MLAENRESRTRFLHTYERHTRRRHHTLDNATLDKFNFICVPLHIEEVSKRMKKKKRATSMFVFSFYT